jgi:hypothetical protein
LLLVLSGRNTVIEETLMFGATVEKSALIETC